VNQVQPGSGAGQETGEKDALVDLQPFLLGLRQSPLGGDRLARRNPAVNSAYTASACRAMKSLRTGRSASCTSILSSRAVRPSSIARPASKKAKACFASLVNRPLSAGLLPSSRPLAAAVRMPK
jgi:hypothetical protein